MIPVEHCSIGYENLVEYYDESLENLEEVLYSFFLLQNVQAMFEEFLVNSPENFWKESLLKVNFQKILVLFFEESSVIPENPKQMIYKLKN